MEIAVLGAGGWGTALSIVLADNCHNVKLWTFENEIAEEINSQRTNQVYIPSAKIPLSIIAYSDINQLVDCSIFVLTVPTKFIRQTLESIDFSLDGKRLINGSKGIESDTLMRISELATDVLSIAPEHYAVLSGPTHAEEVVKRMPSTLVAASEDLNFAKEVQEIFGNEVFRVYTSDDVIGCELGGALKNIIAIAAGIIDGLEMGDNTKAAVITRGLAEISRLGATLGAKPITFSGLSGLGDLVVTCASRHSRNRYVGEQIGKGLPAKEVFGKMKMVAEGVNTTLSAYKLGKKFNVELPITEQMYEILFEGKDPRTALKDLMTRRSRREWWW